MIIFAEVQTAVFGDKLKQQVEDRLKFYECGDVPKKNIDVMKEAMEEAAAIAADNNVDEEGKKKKKKVIFFIFYQWCDFLL